VIALIIAAAACSSANQDDNEADTGESDNAGDGRATLESQPEEVNPLLANAELTIVAQRDTVSVAGEQLRGGAVVEGAPGDLIEVDQTGAATLTAEAAFEIEALRGATLTVPDFSVAPATVDLEAGHLILRLSPDIDELTIDTGARQFVTRARGTELALCQGGDGASCLVVIAGEVDWIEDGVASETYTAGRATFAAPGDAPLPTRCFGAEQLDTMRTQLRGTEFSGVLAEIVDTWPTCTDDSTDLRADATIPSAARMEHVLLDEQVLGSPDADGDTANVLALHTVAQPVDYYIEPRATTNVELRIWLANTAGDDPALWEQLAPAEWLDRAPGGAATQAAYADGTADQTATGVSFDTAKAFCEAQNKRLATETEWELAATNGILEDLQDEAQDWVTDWEAYGPGPGDAAGRQVLRGNDGVLGVNTYYRVFAPTDATATAAHRHARIRCAASEVALGGRTFEEVVFEDDFNGFGWPLQEDDPFELDYHPDAYHLDVHQDHSQGAVVRTLAEPLDEGRVDTDLFIERTNTSDSGGAYRFGVVFGRNDDLYTLTVQPDEFSGQRFTACVFTIDPLLAADLDLQASPLDPTSEGRAGAYGVDRQDHHGQDCVDAERQVEVPVSSIDDPVRLSVVLDDGRLETWVNDVEIPTSVGLSNIGVYGFFSQTYERTRTHIHYDDLLITR
jgi:hypothetical protein